MSFKITINNEEVVSNSNLQIKEEMLSTSSTILKNCYPKSWENDKDYVSRYYFPKDYSKCKITNVTEYPEDPGIIVKGTNLNINYDNTKNWELKGLYGNTLQNGTPKPSSPVPIQNVTGLQKVNVCGKNVYNATKSSSTLYNVTYSADTSKVYFNGTSNSENKIELGSMTLPSGTYTLNLQRISSNRQMTFYLYEAGTWTNVAGPIRINESTLDKNYITFTLSSSKAINLALYVGNGQQYTSCEVEYQIIKGNSSDYDFEPYKGNTYEVNLGKNLLDISDITTTSYITNNGDGSITLNGAGQGGISFSLSKPFTLKANTTYTLSLTNTNSSYSNATFILRNGNTNKLQINYATNSVSYTPTNDIVIDIIRIYSPAEITFNNFTFSVQLEKGSQSTSFSPYFTPIELNKIGDYQDRIYKDNGKWYVEKKIGKVVLNGTENWSLASAINNHNRVVCARSDAIDNNTTTCYSNYFEGVTRKNLLNVNQIAVRNTGIQILTDLTFNNFITWLSTHNTEVLYVLATPTYTEITNEELIEQLETLYQSQLYNGINNISVNSVNLPSPLEIHYNFNEEYTTEDLIFCGCIKNTGKISLNPREPHYCDLQILDFKTLLSEGDCLNYVISNKTISEAINQVVSSISDYGFVVGNIQLLNPNEIIGAYSTLNKTAYDVFQYFADITQSRWTTRVIDENTIAIDFYEPTLMPQGTQIQSTTEFYENNDIVDISFNYSTNDYRNKQIMTSDEVFANITQTQTIIADGYTKNFMCENKIGIIETITLNGESKTFATKNEQGLGITADFYYQPGEMQFISSNTIETGSVIVITYYPIVKGREIILNTGESARIETQIGRKGTLSRYENRNDTTSSQELQKIGQSYIKYKGQAEITLKVVSTKDIWNIGQIVNYDAPLEELNTDYMVKSKSIDMYLNAGKIFYTYELTSNFNYENAVNYFDNQRAKNQGNIGEGETITRNIDLTNNTLILFYDTDVEEIEVQNPTSLDFALDGILI